MLSMYALHVFGLAPVTKGKAWTLTVKMEKPVAGFKHKQI